MSNECVYTISEGPLGPTKIGISTSDARFGALQTGNPRPLNAGISLPCQHAKDIERGVHARLAYRRLKGEWFDVTPEEAEAAIDAVIRQRCGPKPRAKPSAAPAVPVVTGFAPPGVCVYCDHRRAKVAEAVRLHRAKRGRTE